MFPCNLSQDEVPHQRLQVSSKKHALSPPEGSVQQGPSYFYARSVCLIREHGKNGENAAGSFFQQTHPFQDRGGEEKSIRSECAKFGPAEFF
jgi:hypothetical protein